MLIHDIHPCYFDGFDVFWPQLATESSKMSIAFSPRGLPRALPRPQLPVGAAAARRRGDGETAAIESLAARGTANVRDASAPAGGARRVPAGTAVRGVGTSAHRAHSANSTAGGTRMNMNAMRDRIRALAVSKK